MNKCGGVWRWISTPIRIEIKARTFASRAGTVFDGRFNIIDIEAVDKHYHGVMHGLYRLNAKTK